MSEGEAEFNSDLSARAVPLIFHFNQDFPLWNPVKNRSKPFIESFHYCA